MASQYQKIDYEQALLMTYIEHLTMKQEEIALIEGQMREFELLLKGRAKDRSISMIRKEKEKMETSWSFAQEKITILEEELIQYRSQLELFQSRIGKEKNIKHELQAQLKEILSKRSMLEEQHQQKVQEMHQKYSVQLESLQSQFEQEMDQMQREHQLAMKEIQDKSHQELTTMQRLHEKELEGLRSSESSEKLRQREDLLSRVTEKTEEVRQLKQQLESQQQKFEKLFQENEEHKAEIKQNQLILQQQRQELDKKQEEIQSLAPLKVTVQQLQQKIIESQEIAKKESIEKLQITFQRDQSSQQLADLTKIHRELEQECQAMKIENHRLSYATSDLTTKTEVIGNFQKEIESYRDKVQKLSNEILEGQYKYQHVLKEQELLQQEYQRVLTQARREQEASQQLSQQIEQLQQTIQKEKQAASQEREERKKAEGVVQELRSNLSKLQLQHEESENERLQEEQERLQEREEWKSQLNDWVSIYSMMMQALEDWEAQWGTLFEGENPPVVQQGHSLASWLSVQQRPPYPRQQATYLRGGTPSKGRHLQGRTGSKGQRAASPAPGSYRQTSYSLTPVYASDHDYYADLVSNHILEAKQEMAVGIERLSLKAEKLQSIRSYFLHEHDKAMAPFQPFAEKVQTTLSRYEEQLRRLSSDLSLAQRSMAQRETVISQEREQFQSLREMILKEQQEKYHQLEAKYTEMVFQYESLQRQDDNHQKQLQQLIDENKDLQQTILTYKKERQQLKQLEETLQSFHQKYDTIRSQFRSVETEKQKLESSLQQLQHEQHQWSQEKQNLLLDHERMLMQLNLLKDSLSEAERKYQQATHEVEKLRLRPMDVELALKLLTNGETGHYSAPTGGNAGGGAARHLLQMFERLSPTKRQSAVSGYSQASQYPRRSNESIYFPSRRGLMATGTDRYETLEDTSFSQSQTTRNPAFVNKTSTGDVPTAATPVGSAPAASISLRAMTSPRPGEPLSSTGSSHRLSSLDRSLQLLTQKIDAFEQSNK